MTRFYQRIQALGKSKADDSRYAVREELMIPEGLDPMAEALRRVADLRACELVRVRITGETKPREISVFHHNTRDDILKEKPVQRKARLGYGATGMVKEFDFKGTQAIVSRGSLESYGKVPKFGPAEVR